LTGPAEATRWGLFIAVRVGAVTADVVNQLASFATRRGAAVSR